MTAWTGRSPGRDDDAVRRHRAVQGVAAASFVSLALHLLAVYAPPLSLRSPAAHLSVAPALRVRTISVEPAHPREPSPERVASPAPAAARSVVATAANVPEARREAPSRIAAAAPQRPADANAARPPATPSYLPAGALDPPPRPLQDIEPEYPPEAGFQEGTVVLRLLISETGHVDRVDVLSASPPGLFDAAARTAFASARFSPGRLAGLPVKCQMTIEVAFMPINRGGEVSGRTY